MLHVHVLREESLPTGIWILCLRKHVCITYTIHELLYVILIVRFFRKFLYAFSIATIFYYVMRSEIIYLCHLLPSVPHESSGFVQMLRVTLNTILIIFCSNRKLFFFYRKQTVLIFSYKQLELFRLSIKQQLQIPYFIIIIIAALHREISFNCKMLFTDNYSRSKSFQKYIYR